MKAGKYCFKDLFVNRYVQRIIVPEIQRDYVWGEIQVKGLLNSILSDWERYLNGSIPSLLNGSEDDLQAFKSFYKRRNYSSNIGFIYAYNEPSYDGKYFLIDGQQRVTTLYLLLAVLANRNKLLREHFKRNYCFEGLPKLGYRVRIASNEFLNIFIDFVMNGGSNIDGQLWMLDYYKNDITGHSILSNYKIIHSVLDEKELKDEELFFSYVEELTEFWYFDTNVSEQG